MADARCNYCGKERPREELETREIWFRKRVPYGGQIVARKTGLYCKQDGCGGKDQMAHEG